MADRHRSHDHSRDSDKVLGDDTQVSQQGREGGDLERDIATRDELKRARERPAGHTDVEKSDEREGKR